MSNWEKIYKSKLLTVEEAAAKIESGDRIYAGGNLAMPRALLDALADRKDELRDVTVSGATSLYPFKIQQSGEYRGKINYITTFLSVCEVPVKDKGNIVWNSVHLSRVGYYLTEIYKCNVLLTECSVPDDEGYLYYSAGGVMCNWDVAQKANKIILSVNRYQGKTAGYRHRIHISEVSWICEDHHPLQEFHQPAATLEELKMVDYILPLIPDGATIQLGLGGLPNAIGYCLESKKNLSVHSELYTDSMAYLAKKGVITGKQVAAFILGCQPMYDYVFEGHVELKPFSIVNDPYEIGKNDNMISINSCLMADLTGQVCSESIGLRQYSSTGGQLDFVRGASLSKGGKSFLCLPSLYKSKDGKVESRIKLSLPPGAAITTPRSDVMYIVTEYGIANLYLANVEDRVKQMISIAHPDYRNELRRGAIREGLLRE